MSEPEKIPETPEERAFDRWVRPLFADSLLWPVTFAVGTAAAMLFAMVLVFATRERSPFAVVALLGLVWLSLEPLRADFARRRLGPGSGLVIGLWVVSAALAAVGARFDLL